MSVIPLSFLDLLTAACLVAGLAGLTVLMHLGLGRSILTAALRTTVQLLLVGLVLETLFSHAHPLLLLAMALVMLGVAAREIVQRQHRRFSGWWGFGTGAVSMLLSSFSVAVLALVVMVGVEPWYAPRYAIPLLGMLLGNTMNGIALGLDRLTATAWREARVIEARLLLGCTWSEAVRDIQRESVRAGLIPVVNAMAVAGLVSLPGMMTGQILAGSPPLEAVKYQILIMFLIATGTGLGTLAAVRLGAQRLFDDRHRLRLDRLRA
jgi:putative ABC transport system permease protein